MTVTAILIPTSLAMAVTRSGAMTTGDSPTSPSKPAWAAPSGVWAPPSWTTTALAISTSSANSAGRRPATRRRTRSSRTPAMVATGSRSNSLARKPTALQSAPGFKLTVRPPTIPPSPFTALPATTRVSVATALSKPLVSSTRPASLSSPSPGQQAKPRKPFVTSKRSVQRKHLVRDRDVSLATTLARMPHGAWVKIHRGRTEGGARSTPSYLTLCLSHQHEVPDVNQEPHRLTDNDHRVLSGDRIGEQSSAPQQA